MTSWVYIRNMVLEQLGFLKGLNLGDVAKIREKTSKLETTSSCDIA